MQNKVFDKFKKPIVFYFIIFLFIIKVEPYNILSNSYGNQSTNQISYETNIKSITNYSKKINERTPILAVGAIAGEAIVAMTLAEVLITLTVIGVVSAMAIPSLMNSTNNQEMVSRLLKVHGVLNESMQKYMTDNGCIGDISACSLFDNGSSITLAKTQATWDKLKPYFSLAKDCGTTPNLGCFALNTEYKWLNGTYRGDGLNVDNQFDMSAGIYGYAKGILNDGVSISIIDWDGNCNTNRSLSGNNSLKYSCAMLNIDLNGNKDPNQFGRDLFSFLIVKNGTVMPEGSLDEIMYTTNNTPECDPSNPSPGYSQPGSGVGCAAKIIKEKAMNY